MSTEHNYPPQSWHAHVDSSGRILLPVELRKLLNVGAGDSLTWVTDESGLHLKSYDQTVTEIQSYFTSLAPVEELWSEELLADRSEEVSLELRS